MAMTPAGSRQQRDTALSLANETRCYRAALKRGIKEGRIDIAEVLRDPHPFVRRMAVIDLLKSMPRVADLTAQRVMREIGASNTRDVISLTHRQVEAIAERVGRPNWFAHRSEVA